MLVNYLVKRSAQPDFGDCGVLVAVALREGWRDSTTGGEKVAHGAHARQRLGKHGRTTTEKADPLSRTGLAFFRLARVWLLGDPIRPLVANLLAGYDQPVLLGQRATRTEHCANCMFQPTHLGHDLLQRRPALALEHRDHLAGLASLPRCTSFFRGGGGGRLFRAAGLLLRGRLRRRHVGRLWRNGGTNGGFLAFRNDLFRLGRFAGFQLGNWSGLGNLGSRSRFRNTCGFFGGGGSLAKALDRFPD